MPDPVSTASPTADEDRLSAAVGRLRQNVIDAHQFRPSDPALVAKFDSFLDDMLQTLIETSQAAAVDRVSIIVAKDLSAQRQQFTLESMKLRDATDLGMQAVSAQFLPTLLKVGGGA